ncbi:MAG: TraR/DksA C4-type zinc finger protein, partial [Thermodesulfovibrionales bacterium]
ESGKSVRVVAKEESREKAKEYFPAIDDKYKRQLEAYKVMTDEELFYHEIVHVQIPEEDMPGRPLRRVKCDRCGEYVQDKRELRDNGSTLCRPCAGGRYYSLENTIDD